jgi:hypothetical protein
MDSLRCHSPPWRGMTAGLVFGCIRPEAFSRQRNADSLARLALIAEVKPSVSSVRRGVRNAQCCLHLLILERIPVMFVNKRSQHGSENSCILRD